MPHRNKVPKLIDFRELNRISTKWVMDRNQSSRVVQCESANSEDSIKVLSALMGKNCSDQPHLGPTPTHSLVQALPLTSGLCLQSVSELHCRCTCL